MTNRGEVRPWGAFLQAMSSAMGAQKPRGGAGIRILSGPITSPSLAETMATVLREFPQATWHQDHPIARAGQAPVSPAGQPIYRLDKADVVVSLESDFLTCGPQAVRMQKDFAGRRRVTDERKEMNRLYVVESTPTLTGTKADHRLAMPAGEIENFTRELAAAVGGSLSAPGASVPRPGVPDVQKWVAAVAKDLQSARGRSVVIAGEYQPAAVHALAQSMNQALGNVGTTVTYGHGLEVVPGGTGSIADLAQAMDAGQVELLIVLGGNPVYSAPVDLKFGERLAKVALAVYHGLYADETANLCHWNIPATHPLESWGTRARPTGP